MLHRIACVSLAPGLLSKKRWFRSGFARFLERS